MASLPQNRKGYWSIIVCTTSSKYGLIASNLPKSLNSIGKSVGHQQIAKFLLSILFSLQFSATLQKKIIQKFKTKFPLNLEIKLKYLQRRLQINKKKILKHSLYKMLKNEFKNIKVDWI